MINLKTYDTVNDFKNKKIKMTRDMDISMQDLIRYAISLGNYSSYKITKKGGIFYRYLLEMSLEEYISGKIKYFKIGEDYKHAEASIKSCISFFMGMVAAKAVAEKKYKVSRLYHLTDEIIISTPVAIQTTVKTSPQNTNKTKRKYRPDFFGVNNNNGGILFEAKGTASTNFGNKTIEHAKEQIRNINCVTLKKNTGYQKYNNSQLKGYIVISSFDENDLLVYHCIDPEPEEKEEIVIDWEKATILYYQHIMNFLIYNKKVLDDQDPRFIISEYGLYKIGIDKRIYKTLEKYKEMYAGNEKNDVIIRRNLIEDCEKILSYTLSLQDSVSTEKVSLGLDGIICK